jgi:hypothetical protein
MAAGSFAWVTGSGQSVPTTSSTLIDMGTVGTDSDSILTETSSGVYRPNKSGYYLIVAEGFFTTTHANRFNNVFELYKNTSTVSGACGSGYARDANNKYAWTRAMAILPFDGSTDTFKIHHYMDVGGGTPAGSYTWTRIKVIQLTEGTSGVAYGRYGTPTAGAYGDEGLSAIPGWDVETETDTDVIVLQGGTAEAIRLKEKDRPYLIVYGLKNSDSGTSERTMRCTDVEVGGTRVNHSFNTAYQRDSSTQYAFPSGLALVKPTAVDQDAKIRCCGYIDNKATLWGTWSNSSWSLSSASNASGVMIIALPSTTKIAIFKDDTASQTVTTTTVDLNTFRDTVGTADSPFTWDNDTDVSVASDTDVLAYGTFHEERTASSGTRWTGSAIWEVEGTDQTNTQWGNYERGEQGAWDNKNAACSAMFLGATSTNDTFQLEYQKVGEAGNNNATSWVGSFFIDLATLVVTESYKTYKTAGIVGTVNSAGYTIDVLLQRE